MILVLLAILAAMLPAGVLLRRSRNFGWYLGMILGWGLCILAFLLFSAKNAGYSYYTNRLLFVLDDIRVHLLYTPFTSAQITTLQISGRSIFLFCLLGYACRNCRRIRAHLCRGLIGANGLLCVLNLLLYLPCRYRELAVSDGGLRIMAWTVRAWSAVVIVLSAGLMLLQYRRTTFRWFRARQAYITYGILGISGFWVYVVLRGPIQYLEPRTYFHLYQSFSYYDPPLTPTEWLIWELLLLLVVVASLCSFAQYSRYQQQLQSDNTRLSNTMMFSRNGVSMLSHAVKNHLISTGFALEDALCGAREGCAEQTARLLEQVLEQNQAMLKRLNRLSAALRQRELDLRPVRLRPILEKAMEDADAPETIRMSLSLEDPGLVLMADEQALGEAVLNILVNAVEAIRDAPGRICITQTTENAWCLVRIQDNGPGMDALQLEKAFDPFYSSKSSASNWGMGLSFARQTVAAHGGILEASGTLRGGCTFTLALPIAPKKGGFPSAGGQR